MTAKYKVRPTVVALGLACGTQAFAETPPARFSEFEQAVWQIVQGTDTDNPLSALKGLEPAAATPADRALLLMHQCRLAVRQHQQPQPAILSALQQLQQTSEVSAGAAALSKCRQYHAMLDPGAEQILQLENTAYYGLNASDGAFINMWLSFDFANAAMDAGFTDEALQAIQRSIDIAKQNKLTEWVSESLGLLALLQSDLSQFDQALQTVRQAISQAKDPVNIETLHLRQAFILKQAKKYDQALAIYQQLLRQSGAQNEQLYITAALNISAIYQATQRDQENLQLTEQLLLRCDKQKDPYSWSQAATLRAIALLRDGRFHTAAPLFAEAQQWFEQNEWLIYLVPTLEQWADLLADKGHFEQAFQAARQARSLRSKLNEQRRLRDATLQNAQLEVARQQQALLESKQAHQQVAAELERKKLQQRQFQTISAAVLLFALVIAWAYLRLRHANQRLAQKISSWTTKAPTIH